MKLNEDDLVVAERRLVYSVIGETVRNEVIFRLSKPCVTEVSEAPGIADGNTCTCEVTIEGLNESSQRYFGMDAMQAIQIAADLDPLIKRLSAKYQFYWPTGEPYFDD